jgi:hypothetical protein
MNTESIDAISRHLREMSDKNPNARALFEYLATYENNMRKTYVHNLAHGSGLSQSQVRKVFKQLEQDPFEIGKLRVGRRGHSTRFEWVAPLTAVAAAALGQRDVPDQEIASDDWAAEAIDPEEEDDDMAAKDSGKKTHRFHLRRDFEATLALPVDLTEKDVERLCNFLKALPVD